MKKHVWISKRWFSCVFFRERGRRGRSRRETGGKIVAATFSRCEFFMVLGARGPELVGPWLASKSVAQSSWDHKVPEKLHKFNIVPS